MRNVEPSLTKKKTEECRVQISSMNNRCTQKFTTLKVLYLVIDLTLQPQALKKSQYTYSIKYIPQQQFT